MTPTSNPFVDDFCVQFENATNINELVHAYGNYIQGIVSKMCAGKDILTCLDTHDPRSPQYTDNTSEDRAWLWQICTEYAYWQTAPPLWHYKPLVSRKLTTDLYQHQCPLAFGEHQVPFRPHWRDINHDYGGWHLRLTRVFWIDGEWDPWRSLSVQSEEAPDRSGWPDDAEFAVLPESVHHWVSRTSKSDEGMNE